MERARLKRTCERLFERSGGSTRLSGLFDELSPNVRRAICEALDLEPEELPILASVPTPQRWVVVTTDRVVYRSNGDPICILLHDLQDAHSSLLDDANRSRDNILVLLANGKRHEATVEAGYPLSGIWNVLRYLQRRLMRNEG